MIVSDSFVIADRTDSGAHPGRPIAGLHLHRSDDEAWMVLSGRPHVTMSVDGFIAGPGDAMEWAFDYGRPGPVADEMTKETGAILAGCRGYDLGIRPGSGPKGIYGGS